ncbi:hypothetical protein TorRG33x02_118400 [Trema orientale]|uniref:Uncharacterized protein n=1 Tax=Trema orientale TaxID=63057 RepID=A0A2P5F3F8_TREOI|nr:hypothetical protein TorRG33x02_118400 [Trema orientale]
MNSGHGSSERQPFGLFFASPPPHMRSLASSTLSQLSAPKELSNVSFIGNGRERETTLGAISGHVGAASPGS